MGDKTDVDHHAPQAFTGSCLCRATRYTISGPAQMSVLCHCISCKKWSGSAFAYNVWLPASSFALDESSRDVVKTYADSNTDSGRTIEHHFCSLCGSSIYNTAKHMESMVAVTSGTIDGPNLKQDDVDIGDQEGVRLKGMEPGVEVYCKRKLEWVDIDQQTRRFEELPEH